MLRVMRETQSPMLIVMGETVPNVKSHKGDSMLRVTRETVPNVKSHKGDTILNVKSHEGDSPQC